MLTPCENGVRIPENGTAANLALPPSINVLPVTVEEPRREGTSTDQATIAPQLGSRCLPLMISLRAVPPIFEIFRLKSRNQEHQIPSHH